MLAIKVDEKKEKAISVWHGGEKLKIGTFCRPGSNHITHITFDGPMTFEIIRDNAKHKIPPQFQNQKKE